MLLFGNATEGWRKSQFFFTPHYIGEISKVVLKKTPSCNTPVKLSAILFAQHTLAVMCMFHTQHKLVINAHISVKVFLQTTLLIFYIVRVRVIKILPNCCWHFELALFAIHQIWVLLSKKNI